MTEKEITKITNHPMEDFLNIESNSTEVVKIEEKTEAIKIEEFDDKDNENERLLLAIHDMAISDYKNQIDALEDGDPRFVARGREVANQTLAHALEAVKAKIGMKANKDKINKTDKSNKSGGTTVIMDTNALIAEIRKAKAAEAAVIDVTPEEIKKP